MEKCPQCGAEVTTDLVFCRHCGARLKSPVLEKVEEERLNQEISKRDAEISSLKGQLEQAERRCKNKKGVGIKWIIIGMVLLLTLGCVALYQGEEAAYYRRRYNSISYECSELEDQNSALAEQAEFMDQYIGIIDLNSDDDLYHTYTCDALDWEGDWHITAYTVNGAKNKGYEPCPECH